MERKRNYIVLLAAVLSLGLLLAGGTYAWLLYDNIIVTGNGLQVNSTCFIVDYTGEFPNMLTYDLNNNGELEASDAVYFENYLSSPESYPISNAKKSLLDLNNDGQVDADDREYLLYSIMFGAEEYPLPYMHNNILFPSNTDKGGVMGIVTMNINESCDVNANANIKLNIGSATSSKYFAYDSKLKKYVLGYSLYASDNTTLLGSGSISKTGDITLNTGSIRLSNTPTSYYVYVWLNGASSVVDNSYFSLPFSGYLHADAIQTES